RLGAGVHRLRRLLGVAAIGDASPQFLRALGFRPHVLHGRPSDAGGALGRQAQPGSHARPLHGRGIDRSGPWPIRGRLARRLGGAAADAPPVRHQPRRCGYERDRRAADQARRAQSAPSRYRRCRPDRQTAHAARLRRRHGLERGDGHVARSPGHLSTGARRGTAHRFRPHRPALARPLAGFAGLARVLRPADLRHRPHPAHLDEHARKRGAFLVLALPLSLPTMYGILICLGFAMGIASTLTLSGVMHLAPREVCGTALTLRMTGNRVGQIVFPALAGVLAAATGVAGILLALGLGLAASGIAVAMTQPPSTSRREVLTRERMPSPIQIRMGGYGPASTGFSRALKLIGDRLTAEFGERVDVKYVWNIMELGYRAEDILWLVEHGLLTLGY